MTPGIHEMSNDAYHASEGVSRSTLWTLYTKTPLHARFPPPPKKAVHFDFGRAVNDAILQPDIFEGTIYRGPAARGNSNEWKNAEEFAHHNGLTILKPDDYDGVLRARDAALSIPIMREIVDGGLIERSAYAVDIATGLLVKVRPDVFNPRLHIMADVKTTTNAGKSEFSRSIGKFGYHVQEYSYGKVWAQAGGDPVDGFVFVVFEKEEPFEAAVYELTPNAVAEGAAIYEKALRVYAECKVREDAAKTPEERRAAWPGYPREVQQIKLHSWDYRETTPEPEAE